MIVPLSPQLLKNILSIIILLVPKLVNNFAPDVYGNKGFYTNWASFVMELVIVTFAALGGYSVSHDQQSVLYNVFQNFTALRREIESEQIEFKRNNNILLSVIPQSIINRMTQSNNSELIFDNIESGTIVFIKLEGFEQELYRHDNTNVLQFLNSLFVSLDALCIHESCQKIKSIQNIFLASSGIEKEPDHMEKIAAFAVKSLKLFELLKNQYEPDFVASDQINLKIGIASGSFCAGVLGTSKFLYDVFGDVVNTSSRMTYASKPGKIQICGDELVDRLKSFHFKLELRGPISVKGKGTIITHWLLDIPSTNGNNASDASKTHQFMHNF